MHSAQTAETGLRRGADPFCSQWLGTTVVDMPGRYDQMDLNVYGAEDDDEMDSILDALERADDQPEPPLTLPNPTLDRRR